MKVYTLTTSYERLMALTDLVKVFKALGDERRLQIVHTLNEETLCVCDLADRLNVAQPTLSHHLKVLREAGLVRGQRRGPWTYCTLNDETFRALGLDVEHIFNRTSREAKP